MIFLPFFIQHQNTTIKNAGQRQQSSDHWDIRLCMNL
jgi:hypothetical protein